MRIFIDRLRATFDRMTTWDRLRWLGSTRLATSSSFFLFLVPVTARLLSDVPDKVQIPLTNSELILNLRLPFYWILFFFSALFLLIGNLIFFFRCPSIVRLFASFSEYSKSGRSSLDLITYLKEIIPSTLKNQLVGDAAEAMQARSDSVKYVLGDYLKVSEEDKRRGPMIQCINPATKFHLAEELLPRAFTTLRDASTFCRRPERAIVGTLFGLALACFAVVIIQNVYFVLSFVSSRGL